MRSLTAGLADYFYRSEQAFLSYRSRLHRNASVESPRSRWRAPLNGLRKAASAILLSLGALGLCATPAAATVVERITTTTINLPQALEGATNNFCTGGFCTGFSPRLYQAPMADGRTLIGWTDTIGTGHVSRVNGATVEATFDFAATPVRGLVAHADGTFAVLLQSFPPGAGYFDNNKKLSKRAASGVEIWTSQLPKGAFNSIPNPTSFGDTGIGDSRLSYRNGTYAAYYSAHTEPDAQNAEHEGEHLFLLNDAGVLQTGGTTWGLSHSMAGLVDFHPELNRHTALGVSDCFPAIGLYADHTNLLLTTDGNCGATVWSQLGQMAAANGGRWVVAFNGQQNNAFSGKGIGILSFDGAYVPSGVTWLTGTSGAEERDPVLARVGTSLSSNRFLVGWRLQTADSFHMAVVDSAGTVLDALETVSPAVGWGNRDDSLKSRPDGSISWLQGSAGSTTLKFHRYNEGGGPPAAALLVTPTGSSTNGNPTYTWNAVANSSWYYLWVMDGTGTPIKKWLTAANANCGAGTGTCSHTPVTPVVGQSAWWIRTWNTTAAGPWSSSLSFAVGGDVAPVAATLVSPNGAGNPATPTYTWNAVPNATWYYLWVNTGATTAHVKWYTAVAAGCGGGTGTCSVTPTTNIAGNSTWWIRTWNPAGEGPWSAGMAFSQ